ncbi:hypothetical protein CerSpe_161210 [Prunus speciosa]
MDGQPEVLLWCWEQSLKNNITKVVSYGGWIAVTGLPIHWWSKKYFERIGDACGGLLEVGWKTEKLKYLIEAKLKVRKNTIGFLPELLKLAEENEVYYVQIRPISPAIRPNQSVRNKSVELTPAPTWGGVFRLEKQIAKEGGSVIEGTSPDGSPHEARGIAESQITRTLPLVVGRSMEVLTLVEQLHIAQKEKVYVELKDKGMFKDAKRGLSGSEVGPIAISIKAQELGRTEGLPHEFWEKTRSNQDYMLLPTNRPTRHSEFGMGLRNKWVHPKSPTSVPNLFTRFGQNKNKGKGLSRVSPSKFGNQREKDKVVGARKQNKGKLTTVINHYDKESADESLQEEGSYEEGIGLSEGT